MPFDSVPWFVEGGAVHSAQIARVLAYAAFNGSEGIIGSTDLYVRTPTVPGASVRVTPGACAILNRSLGANYEAYVGRMPTETVVPIAATGSSARSDMVVAVVKNPWLAGETWPTPADPAVGPYIDVAVISGVSSTATLSKVVRPGWSAIPLARIDIPVNTATITQSMIKDLRFLSQARSHRELNVWSPNTTTYMTTAWNNFPGSQNGADNMSVTVPEWATHATLRAILGHVTYGKANSNTSSNVHGYLRMQLGGSVFTEQVGFNLSVASYTDSSTLLVGANSVAIPAAMRGTKTGLLVEGKLNASAVGSIWTDPSSMCSYEVEWLQRPDVMDA